MGHRSVREAQKHIDAREFAEWLAFDRTHPIGWERFDTAAAMIAMVTASAWGGKRKFKLEDFQMQWGRKAKTSAAMIEAKSRAVLAGVLEEK